jgi:uncharacterized RDD family membrane protein YckC
VGRTDSYPGPDTFAGVDQATTYPGQRLGLPEHGPGSVASWPVRFLALLVDWLASMLVASVIVGESMWSSDAPKWPVMTVFLAELTLFTALAQGSFGQVLLRIAVVRLDRKPVNVLQGLLRSLLICLVVPPLVFNRDSRGLHDLAVGTIVVRR